MWIRVLQLALVIGLVSADFSVKTIYMDNRTLTETVGTARIPFFGKNLLDNKYSELLRCVKESQPSVFYLHGDESDLPSLVIYGSYIANERTHISPVSTQAQRCDNLSPGVLTCEYSREVTYRKSVTVKSNHTFEAGGAIKGEFKFAFFAKLETKIAARYAFMAGKEQTTEATETFSVKGSYEAAPHTKNVIYMTDQYARVEFDVVYQVGVQQGRFIIYNETVKDSIPKGYSRSVRDILNGCPKSQILQDWKQTVTFETSAGVDIVVKESQ